MSDLSQLYTPATQTSARTSVLRARVSQTPASDTDTLRVVAQGYSIDHDYEVPAGQWTPRGAALPQAGALCLLVLDDNGDAFVPVYDGPNEFGGDGGTTIGEGFMRFRCATGNTIPAATWTFVPALSVGSQVGAASFELVASGTATGALRCLVAGVYSFGASVTFDAGKKTGAVAIRLRGVAGPDSGWAVSASPTIAQGQMPISASFDVYCPRGAVIGLEAWSDTSVKIDTLAGDPWLSVARLAGGSATPGGGDLTYVHVQGPPSETWTVIHDLGKFPAVDVVDSGDSAVIPSVHYDSLDAITLTFGSATSGRAFVN